MMEPVFPDSFVMAAEQPEIVDFDTCDGVAIKVMRVQKALTFIPQHSHPYEHGWFLATGAVWLWLDGHLDKQYRAPCLINIHAGRKHLFQTLEDNTMWACIHNTARKEIIEILAEYQLVGAG